MDICKKYNCYYCNAVFIIEEIGGNDTDIIYCPNCGNDTLLDEKGEHQ